MAKKAAGASALHKQMEEFFASPLAERAAGALSDRARILLHVGEKNFLFQREKGANRVRPTAEDSADVHFWVPVSTMRHLLDLSALPGTGLGAMGVAVFERIFHPDESLKIRFRVDSGFLTLWGKGYFSVLKAGGPEVASYLARLGFGSLSKIKDVLGQLRK